MPNVRGLGLSWGAVIGVVLIGVPTAAGELTILAPRPHQVIQRVGFQPGTQAGETIAAGQADLVAAALRGQDGVWTSVSVVEDERGVARFVTAVRR